ncbi:MAG: winged helix-turn-helix domain-containing protein [Candidatus Acidiferrales bacterium]
MAEDPHPAFRMRFGAFEVDLDERDLRRDGVKIKLNEKPFQVLAVLLERAGRVVRRDEIRARLWPADTYVDFDANLNTALSTLRHALGDSADKPQYIETVPRQGYRFIAGVLLVESAPIVSQPVVTAVDAPMANGLLANTTALAQAGAAAEIDLASADSASPFYYRASRAAITAMACAFVIALAVAGVFYLRHGRASADAWNDETKVLVAPFENLSGDASQDYLSDGVTEELITQLGARSPSHIAVVARSAGMQYRDHHAPLDKIASEQKVGYVVEGTLNRQSDHLHLTAQLFQASDGKIIWAQSYDRGSEDLPAVEQDVAVNVARVLDVNVFEKPSSLVVSSGRPHQVNPDAYDHYLRGLYEMKSHTATGPDRTADSVKDFKRAIELDSQFAEPYVGLAQTYITAAEWSETDSRTSFLLAKAAAQRAIALDDSLADAHMILGMTLYESDWDWHGAEQEFHRALAVDPNSAHSMRIYAMYLAATQRFKQAMDEYQRAEKIDPDPTDTDMNICTLLAITRNYDKAITQCKKVLDESPKNSVAEYYLAASYVYRSCYAEALATAKEAGDSPMIQTEVAIAYARSGNRPAAERVLSELESKRARAPISDYALAEVYSELGDKTGALKLLRRAYEERSPELVFLSEDEDFDNLRDTPEFKQLIADIGVPLLQGSDQKVAQIPHRESDDQRGK